MQTKSGRALRSPQRIRACPRATHRDVGSIGAPIPPKKRRCPKPGSALNEDMLRIRGVGHIPCGHPTCVLSKNRWRPHNQPGPIPQDFIGHVRDARVDVHATSPLGIARLRIVHHLRARSIAGGAFRPPVSSRAQTTRISVREVGHRSRSTHESDRAYARFPDRAVRRHAHSFSTSSIHISTCLELVLFNCRMPPPKVECIEAPGLPPQPARHLAMSSGNLLRIAKFR